MARRRPLITCGFAGLDSWHDSCQGTASSSLGTPGTKEEAMKKIRLALLIAVALVTASLPVLPTGTGL
jgi:hypothetical protein